MSGKRVDIRVTSQCKVKMSGIGVNLRVTGHCNQGGRRYMEDKFSVACQQTDDLKDLEYAYFGIFDGHGGSEAATYVKDYLLENIVTQKNFWSDNDDNVLQAIRDGFLTTHLNMWKLVENWPRTSAGLPSTAGTTATIAFIMKGKIYIGHVGDSCVVLGSQEEGEELWKAQALTVDHKPENETEMKRIVDCGGKVITKSGIPRVVWNRPQLGHRGPVRRSTTIVEIPFLAVARSLGDFWSYNSKADKFVVSPEPDVGVIPVDVSKHRCLIFGTDGLWNMMSYAAAVQAVQETESHNESQLVYTDSDYRSNWLNPSKCLVDKAIEKWGSSRVRADNTSVVTLMLDPPGPPRSQVLLNKTNLNYSLDNRTHVLDTTLNQIEEIPPSGVMAIFTHYPSMKNLEEENLKNDATVSTSTYQNFEESETRFDSAPERSSDHRYSTSLASPINDRLSGVAPGRVENTSKFQSLSVNTVQEKKDDEPSRLTNHFSPVSETNQRRRKRSEEASTRDENISDVENESTSEWEGEPKKRRLSMDKTKCNKPSWRQSAGKSVTESSNDNSGLLEIRRTLRSNSAPAASAQVKTLRSRNVDLRSAIVKSDSA